jgi:hypothetical protein
MLTQSDKDLIEKHLDHLSGHPNCPPLTDKESAILNSRMQDSDFTDYLEFSDGVNKAITNEDAIKFTESLKNASERYHKKSRPIKNFFLNFLSGFDLNQA